MKTNLVTLPRVIKYIRIGKKINIYKRLRVPTTDMQHYDIVANNGKIQQGTNSTGLKTKTKQNLQNKKFLDYDACGIPSYNILL